MAVHRPHKHVDDTQELSVTAPEEEVVVVERELVKPSPIPRIVVGVVVILTVMSLLVTLFSERNRTADLEEQIERDRIFAETLDDRTRELREVQIQAEEDRVELRDLVLGLVQTSDPEEQRKLLEDFVVRNGGSLDVQPSVANGPVGGSDTPRGSGGGSEANNGSQGSPGGSNRSPSGGGNGSGNPPPSGGNQNPPPQNGGGNPPPPAPVSPPTPDRPSLLPLGDTVCGLVGICLN